MSRAGCCKNSENRGVRWTLYFWKDPFNSALSVQYDFLDMAVLARDFVRSRCKTWDTTITIIVLDGALWNPFHKSLFDAKSGMLYYRSKWFHFPWLTWPVKIMCQKLTLATIDGFEFVKTTKTGQCLLTMVCCDRFARPARRFRFKVVLFACAAAFCWLKDLDVTVGTSFFFLYSYRTSIMSPYILWPKIVRGRDLSEGSESALLPHVWCVVMRCPLFSVCLCCAPMV